MAEGVVEQDKSGKWEELDHDLLNEIANLNYCYDDYVRIRAVCKQWNMALPKVPPTHTRNPWLVLPFEYKILDRHVLAEKKIYHLKLPEMRDKKLRGSSYGWLTSVAVDGKLRIINPFIKEVYFDLPPIQALPHVVSYDPEKEEYTVKDIKVGDTFEVESVLVQMTHVQKVILSCPPDDNKQECMAMVLYEPTNVRLAFCRLGDDKWIDIPKSKEGDGGCQYEYQDAIFHEGKIYVIDFKGQLFEFEFDMKTSRSIPVGGISQVPPPQDLLIRHPGDTQTYLIGCPKGGGLLMVVRYLNFYRHPKVKKGRECYNSRFDIYKLNKGLKQWSKVFNLGDCALFIGYNSSIWMSTRTLSNGCCGNRICYTDNMIEAQISQKVGGHDIGVFNLEDGKISQLFPDSFLLYPPPVWL